MLRKKLILINIVAHFGALLNVINKEGRKNEE